MFLVEPSKHQQYYVQQKLNDVSRSFALVIPMLEKPLNHAIGTAYLLCRVCDNIEDCTQSFQWKQDRWSEFKDLLLDPLKGPAFLEKWSKQEWDGLLQKEIQLITERGNELWEIYASFPGDTQHILRQRIAEMADGMQYMLSEKAPFEKLGLYQVLRNGQDFDEYCYYVAGTVGHLCTDLTYRFYGYSNKAMKVLNQHAAAFGRSLQKTNILKDFINDLERGICYFPLSWQQDAGYSLMDKTGSQSFSRHVLRDILLDLERATQYIAALPLTALGYRRFCLSAVLPAYQTVLYASEHLDTLFTNQHHCKVSKFQMISAVRKAKKYADDNEWLHNHVARTTSEMEGNIS